MFKGIKHIFIMVMLFNITIIFSSNIEEEKFYSISGIVSNINNEPLSGVEIYLSQLNKVVKSNHKGKYKISHLRSGTYSLLFFSQDYRQAIKEVEITNNNISLSVRLEEINLELQEVEVLGKKRALNSGKNYLNAVENTAIYAAQKTEVAVVDEITANKATNSARQIFASTTGIQIWESDGAGLQLGIGGRGLSPNRSANFNTRQNGYDISADALGYPESYYSPPMEAVEKIEIIRGAASIQYGPQFGGLVNFVMKKGRTDIPMEVISRSTIGSFKLFNSFTSLGGTKGNFNYYAFYQNKSGNGWRDNSGFDVNTGYINLIYSIKDRISISMDVTIMDYIAQQAGGLTDKWFYDNPRQSIRNRNWFKVNWNMGAFTLDYNLTKKSKINWRTFGLVASRHAVGNLGKINRPDDNLERDLIAGNFNNYGSELRFLHKYKFIRENQAFLLGARVYNGHTYSRQGYASSYSDPDFSYLNPEEPGKSVFNFPSNNISLFTSNLIYLSDKWSIVPGARMEYINTSSDGYYNKVNLHPLTGEVLLKDTVHEARTSTRNILLYGLGSAYQLNANHKVYTNYTRNYKSIHFSDMQIVNPNFKIDENLTDETGFNFELGSRGNIKEIFGYDLSVFYLYYHDRIGAVLEQDPFDLILKRVRRNISDSRNIGIESYLEYDIWQSMIKDQSLYELILFTNIARIDARYVNSQEAAFQNKMVENVPKWNIKSGLNFKYKVLKISSQVSYMSKQYTDATNAVESVPSAIYGEIPSYYILDLSSSYELKNNVTLETGVNNISNNMYFTRRAVGYPGPGIIPSDGRNFYLTLQLIF